MIYKPIKTIILSLFFLSTSILYGNDNNYNRIEVLVNENIITKYDVAQRMKINAVLNRIEINNGNYKQLINAVIEDLVIEKLKNKKINEYNITLNRDEFNNYEERFFSSVEYNKQEIKELFYTNDINYDYLLNFIEIELKWQKLIYRLYMRVTSVTKQEIQDFIRQNPNISETNAYEIILQKQLDIKSDKLIKDLRDEATIEFK